MTGVLAPVGYTPSQIVESWEGCPVSTFYHGDCLFVMKHDIPPESVDLIYLDPPFFTGKVQKGRWEPGAMEVSFEDSRRFWAEKANQMRDSTPMWIRHLALKRPDFASYLWYMMARLEMCHRVLRRTGSIYLHCDPRASHYLKMVMDEVFDPERFHNEIIWKRTTAHSSGKKFAPIHDVILYYSKTEDFIWNEPRADYNQQYLDKYYKYDDGDVRLYWRNSLTAAGTRQGDSGQPWRGIDIAATGQHWKFVRESLDALDVEGRIYWPPHGGFPQIKRYRNELKGKSVSDIWDDVDRINPVGRERTGYPTQKPEDLLNRIIDASSNEGGTVLDPFCGCGTTIYAAHKRNREWIGIDINRNAYDATKGREVQLPLGKKEDFAKAKYVSRDLAEISTMDGHAFEVWVNEFYRATKPSPDMGIDGVTAEGVPIQAKVYEIKYPVLSQFITDAKYHPRVPQPVKKVVAVSQKGFDDGARKRKFEIETAEGIQVELVTPEDMLRVVST